MFEHIVIAVDGSDEARRAARRGLRLAQSFDATVDVVSVVEQKALRLTETTDEKDQLREQGRRPSRKSRKSHQSSIRLLPRNC